MPFTFTPTELPDVLLIEPRVFGDDRGFFFESYKQSDFERAGFHWSFVQENHSRSSAGILRGLHYQHAPFGQAKLVRAIVGEIYDVAVDIRRDSPTFGRWVGVNLSQTNRRLLYIPPWCAHGFCVISEDAEVIYKTTLEYRPDAERGIRWDDPTLHITWPRRDLTMSERDRNWPTLAETVPVMA